MSTVVEQSEQIEPRFTPWADGISYSCWHHPEGPPRRLILICPPLYHEYERSHRVLRHLARLCARSGMLVVRFDWPGQGNSTASIPMTPDSWLQAVVRHANEISQAFEGARISLLGLRFGASLALEAVQNTTLFDRCLAWHPVAEGNHMMDEWFADVSVHDTALGYENTSRETFNEAFGWTWTAQTKSALEAYRISEITHTQPMRLLTTASDQNIWSPKSIDVQLDSASPCWKHSSMDEALVPTSTLQSIVQWLLTGAQ